MSKQNRWSQIIDLCRQNETVTVADLVERLNASPATIRRDLQDMEDLRMLERFHGGARLSGSSYNEPAMLIKSELNAHERAISRWERCVSSRSRFALLSRTASIVVRTERPLICL